MSLEDEEEVVDAWNELWISRRSCGFLEGVVEEFSYITMALVVDHNLRCNLWILTKHRALGRSMVITIQTVFIGTQPKVTLTMMEGLHNSN